MESRSLALRLVSEAVHLDSNGFSQAAFAKYLQSLQVLAMYLNELFASLGFQKMVEKVREIKHVSCMIHECSDRVTAIVDRKDQPVIPRPLIQKSDKEPLVKQNTSVESINPTRIPAIEKLQNENMTLLKTYQWRFERAKDNYTRTNLKLELERRLAENDILAKKKFDLAVKQLQKERANMMEKEMKKLFENQRLLNEKEREKRDLYASVLEFTKAETWPCTWKLNSWEDSDIDAAKKIFQKTIRCSDHPLSQWLMMVQTNIKRDVDTTLNHYTQYQKLLPGVVPDSEESEYSIKEAAEEYIVCTDSGNASISKRNILMLEKVLLSISSEIMYTISSVVQIFYVTYKSLLPEDSEEACLKLIESYILQPIWPNLIILYRIVNIVAEYKTLETMWMYRDSKPVEFGCLNQKSFDSSISEQCILLLRSLPRTGSLTEKLKTLVEVSQTICGTPPYREGNQRNRLGADEFMPLLSYIIVKSKVPQLSSECYAIEQLFEYKFMFGEEGYALSSFLTALKYIEMKKLIDGENNTSKTGI